VNLELVAREAKKTVGSGNVIIVIDVLRCTSSIITALANGARSILPVRTLREARQLHQEHPNYILAGERGGLKPIGFTLGNSPLGFKPEIVSEKNIIVTTTSGTAAISRVMEGRHVLLGALLNAKFVAEEAYTMGKREGLGISLALSGKKGGFSLEDFLGAGAIIESLPARRIECSDAAYASFLVFTAAKGSLTTTIQQGNHARILQNLGLEKDVVFCSQLNQYNVIPRLENGRIVRKIADARVY